MALVEVPRMRLPIPTVRASMATFAATDAEIVVDRLFPLRWSRSCDAEPVLMPDWLARKIEVARSNVC